MRFVQLKKINFSVARTIFNLASNDQALLSASASSSPPLAHHEQASASPRAAHSAGGALWPPDAENWSLVASSSSDSERPLRRPRRSSTPSSSTFDDDDKTLLRPRHLFLSLHLFPFSPFPPRPGRLRPSDPPLRRHHDPRGRHRDLGREPPALGADPPRLRRGAPERKLLKLSSFFSFFESFYRPLGGRDAAQAAVTRRGHGTSPHGGQGSSKVPLVPRRRQGERERERERRRRPPPTNGASVAASVALVDLERGGLFRHRRQRPLRPHDARSPGRLDADSRRDF